MNGRYTLTAMLLLNLVSGCATYSPYSIDEQTIQTQLTDQLENVSRDVRVGGMPVTLRLDKGNVAVGPEAREVVRVDFEGQAVLQAPLIPINLSFSIEGKPEYDKEEKAVYVRNVKLLSSNIEAAGSAFSLDPVKDMVSDIAARFLENHPVYRLDSQTGGAELFSLMNLKVSVQPGRIALVPAGTEKDERRPVR